jgi:MYXO-CTERM domain-containing protein
VTLRFLVPALLFAVTVVPKAAMATASAELQRTQTYVYGRFEARIRFAPGSGVVGSFFLWKPGSDTPGAFWNELDFEALGVDCHLQTNSIYGRPSANHEQVSAIPGGICGLYHDYRIDWTPTYIAWAVDGREIRRDTGAASTVYSQNATSGMTFHFNIWPGDSSFGGNLNQAILPVHYYIGWVQYSSFVNNGTFQLQWREEFDGAALPTGWTAGNWASPKNLSTHDPRNITYANGIAILSMTADNAVGAPVVPPADNAVVADAGTVDAATRETGIVDAGARDTSAGGDDATSSTGSGGGAAGGDAASIAPMDGAGPGDAAGGNATSGTGAGGAAGSATTVGAGGTAAGGASTGGVTTSGAGGASTGGASADTPAGTPTDSGCSCRVARGPDSGPGSLWLGMLGLSLLRRRRSRP